MPAAEHVVSGHGSADGQGERSGPETDGQGEPETERIGPGAERSSPAAERERLTAGSPAHQAVQEVVLGQQTLSMAEHVVRLQVTGGRKYVTHSDRTRGLG